MDDMAWRSIRAASKAIVSHRLDLRVEGVERIPKSGPVIIAARHFHHLYDGCAILAAVSRPVHMLVALDWVRNPVGRTVMGRACRMASWPVVLRRDGITPLPDFEALSTLRNALAMSLSILERRRILLVFPEGYPTIDPGYTPKMHDDEFLPFQPGFARLARAAAAQGMTVSIIPAGFHYTRGHRWQVELRFGQPVKLDPAASPNAIVEHVESCVRYLSTAPAQRS